MSDPPKGPAPRWIDNPGAEKRSKISRGTKKVEHRIAEALGGQRIASSGARDWSPTQDVGTAKGDISTPVLHVEHKRTEKASMSLKREWLEKVSQGAKRADKAPAVVITFEESGRKPEDWILLPIEVAQKLLGLDTDT